MANLCRRVFQRNQQLAVGDSPFHVAVANATQPSRINCTDLGSYIGISATVINSNHLIPFRSQL